MAATNQSVLVPCEGSGQEKIGESISGNSKPQTQHNTTQHNQQITTKNKAGNLLNAKTKD